MERFFNTTSLITLRSLSNIVRIIVLVAVFATAEVLFAGHFRFYEAETMIAMVSKENNNGSVADVAIDTAVALPTTLGFYDRLVAYSSDAKSATQDIADASSESERLNLWRERLHVERLGESALIRVYALGETEETARVLGVNAISQLAYEVNRFEGLNGSFALKTIDGPIVSVQKAGHSASSFLWSFLMAITAAWIVDATLKVVLSAKSRDSWSGEVAQRDIESIAVNADIAQPDELKANESVSQQTESAQAVANTNDVAVAIDGLKNEAMQDTEIQNVGVAGETRQEHLQNEVVVEDIVRDAVEEEQQDISTIASGGGLPTLPEGVSLEDYIFGPNTLEASGDGERKGEVPQKDAQGVTVEDESAQDIATVSGEPTPEELRRRLNQLLKGEL